MADIISLAQYVTDIDAFLSIRAVRRQFFAAPYPVTTTVQVMRLYDRITAVAEIPRDRFKPPCAPQAAGGA